MDYLTVGGNVDRLLEELHEKKRWLDTMIEGLEAAKNSPQHRLIEMAAVVFSDAAAGLPKVDLEMDSKRRLTALARRVGPTRRGHPTTSTEG